MDDPPQAAYISQSIWKWFPVVRAALGGKIRLVSAAYNVAPNPLIGSRQVATVTIGIAVARNRAADLRSILLAGNGREQVKGREKDQVTNGA